MSLDCQQNRLLGGLSHTYWKWWERGLVMSRPTQGANVEEVSVWWDARRHICEKLKKKKKIAADQNLREQLGPVSLKRIFHLQLMPMLAKAFWFVTEKASWTLKRSLLMAGKALISQVITLGSRSMYSCEANSWFFFFIFYFLSGWSKAGCIARSILFVQCHCFQLWLGLRWKTVCES